MCLEWNDLGMLEASFAVFCDGLRANTSLKRLDLRNNQITHSGTKELAEALYCNKSLKAIGTSFYVNKNGIDLLSLKLKEILFFKFFLIPFFLWKESQNYFTVFKEIEWNLWI